MAMRRNFVWMKNWKDWPSGLRRYIKTWRDLGSKPTKCSAGRWDPTLLRGTRWFSGLTIIKSSDQYTVSEAAASTMAQSLHWGSQIAVKKLNHSWWRFLSYRHQSIDLLCESMDWCLYNRDLRHERVRDYVLVYSGNFDALAKISELLSTMFSTDIYKVTVKVLELDICLD